MRLLPELGLLRSDPLFDRSYPKSGSELTSITVVPAQNKVKRKLTISGGDCPGRRGLSGSIPLGHSIHDPKDVVDAFSTVLKEQQCSYQHSVENERTVTQRRHRGMLFVSINGFMSQFALDKITPLPSRPCPRPPRPRCPCWLVGLVVLRIILSPLCLLYHAVGSRPIEMSSSMTSKWEGSRLVERLVRAFCSLPWGSLAPGPELSVCNPPVLSLHA
jgi:hypothetical protein